MGTNYCFEPRRTAFKRRESFKDVIYRRYYAERLVAISPIKYNNNTTVEIYPCLYRVL